MLWTTITLSLREIRRHLLRSFLTVLGVVIGVAAVVTMVTLGNAASRSVQTQVSSLGSNLLTVLPGQGAGRGGGAQLPQPFKIADVNAIRGQIGGVTAVAPQVQSTQTAIHDAANWSVTVNGTSDEYLKGQQWALVSGRKSGGRTQNRVTCAGPPGSIVRWASVRRGATAPRSGSGPGAPRPCQSPKRARIFASIASRLKSPTAIRVARSGR